MHCYIGITQDKNQQIESGYGNANFRRKWVLLGRQICLLLGCGFVSCSTFSSYHSSRMNGLVLSCRSGADRAQESAHKVESTGGELAQELERMQQATVGAEEVAARLRPRKIIHAPKRKAVKANHK